MSEPLLLWKATLTYSSMRELLEKAHQQDDEELFKEEEDEEFAAPRECIAPVGIECWLMLPRGCKRCLSGRIR